MRTTRVIDVVVVGGGQAGLAMSRCLTGRSIDHVVYERGAIANSWRTERWCSLRLLTPNWMSGLPGWSYRGPDPDGYMTAQEVVAHLEGYRRSFDAPVETCTGVRRVTPTAGGYVVVTDHEVVETRALVIASGACSDPAVPPIARELPAHLTHLSPIVYRCPEQLDRRPVLVVGAAASGLQIADELTRTGRSVTLAVGEHVRVPRTYRGMDIHWWMDRLGLLDTSIDDVDDLERVRRTPSPQLIGTPERRDLDLNRVAEQGVDVRGRLVGVRGDHALFSGSIANVCALADLKQHRLLDEIDQYARESGLDRQLGRPVRPDPTRTTTGSTELDLSGYGTVVWATGYRPRYPWLDPTLLDGRGRLVHVGGVLRSPGGYVLGLPFMRRRSSPFLVGAGRDAVELVPHLAAHLDRSARDNPRCA